MRATLTHPLIERQRLQAALAPARVTLLRAPGGYGKTILLGQLAEALDFVAVRVALTASCDAAQLVAALGRAFRRAGLPIHADGLEPNDPPAAREHLLRLLVEPQPTIFLVVDDVQLADDGAIEWLAGLAERLPAPSRMGLAGRRLHDRLLRLGDTASAVLLTADALRFEPEETARLMGAEPAVEAMPAQVTALQALTDGWPAAVALAAARPGPSGAPPIDRRADERGLLRGLVERLVAEQAGARQLVSELADLPLLSAQVINLVGGPDAWDRLLDIGLPLRFRTDGWAELPDPVRELFSGTGPLSSRTREVAGIYAEAGELAEAVALLHRAGDPAALLALLGGASRLELRQAGLRLIEAALRGTDDETLAAQPAALVQLVRAAEHQPSLRESWRERALAVLPPGPARRAVEAEQVLDLARAGRLEVARRLASETIAGAGANELATRGRAHLGMALCVLVSDTAGGTGQAAEQLELAIAAFALAGERDWEAEAHQALGYGVHFTTGALEPAAERLRLALALRAAPDAARAATLTFLGEVQTEAGRYEEAAIALREATDIARRLGDPRTIAYAAWSRAELARDLRDGPAALAALDEAQAHPEGWFEGLAGIDFLCQASEIRLVLGDVTGARRDLAQAQSRAGGTPREDKPLAAAARLEATIGDPQLGLRLLDRWDASPLAYRGDRWLRLLLRGACAARLGASDEARQLAERARRAADELGDPRRPARREPELLAIADPAAHPAAATSHEAGATVVRLLGGFAVERDGRDITPPPGRPATLVKLLALRGPLSAEEAIDELWPEVAEDEVGRARLRNLLNRLRSSSGDLVLRRDGALVLHPAVTVDAQRFEAEAATVTRAPAEQRAGLARAALARATGELLPADRYADWATVARERIGRRRLALVDLVVDDALNRGDLDEADRLLDVAISADPLDESRYVRLARALLTQGRMRRAREVAEQAIALADDLEAEPGDDLRKLLAELSGPNQHSVAQQPESAAARVATAGGAAAASSPGSAPARRRDGAAL